VNHDPEDFAPFLLQKSKEKNVVFDRLNSRKCLNSPSVQEDFDILAKKGIHHDK
jgi:hypothetical protein